MTMTITGAERAASTASTTDPYSRSSGGAISVTRSRMSILFGKGPTRISRSSSRAVHAYTVFPSTLTMHSLQVFALVQE